MSSGSDLSPTTALATVTSSSLSAAGIPPLATPTSTTLIPAVVSLLGSLVRNIVQSEMALASTHSPVGSVPLPPCYSNTDSLFGSPTGINSVGFCPCGVVLHYPSEDHFRYALMMLCKSCCAIHPFWHWDHLTIQWQVLGATMQWGGLACIPGVFLDRGHELLQYNPSLSCDRWVPVVRERFFPVKGIIYSWVKFLLCSIARCLLLTCKLSHLTTELSLDPTLLPFPPLLSSGLSLFSTFLFSSLFFFLVLFFLPTVCFSLLCFLRGQGCSVRFNVMAPPIL